MKWFWSRGCSQSWSWHESHLGRGLSRKRCSSSLAPLPAPHVPTTGVLDPAQALTENLRPASGPASGALFPPDLASLPG